MLLIHVCKVKDEMFSGPKQNWWTILNLKLICSFLLNKATRCCQNPPLMECNSLHLLKYNSQVLLLYLSILQFLLLYTPTPLHFGEKHCPFTPLHLFLVLTLITGQFADRILHQSQSRMATVIKKCWISDSILMSYFHFYPVHILTSCLYFQSDMTFEYVLQHWLAATCT